MSDSSWWKPSLLPDPPVQHRSARARKAWRKVTMAMICFMILFYALYTVSVMYTNSISAQRVVEDSEFVSVMTNRRSNILRDKRFQANNKPLLKRNDVEIDSADDALGRSEKKGNVSLAKDQGNIASIQLKLSDPDMLKHYGVPSPVISHPTPNHQTSHQATSTNAKPIQHASITAKHHSSLMRSISSKNAVTPKPTTASPTPNQPHVTIWYPSYPCIGSFILHPISNESNPDSDVFASQLSNDTIVIRDAVVDYRKAGAKFLPSKKHKRLILMVQTRYNLELVPKQCSAYLKGYRKSKHVYLDGVQALSGMLWSKKFHEQLDENYYLLHVITTSTRNSPDNVIMLELNATLKSQPYSILTFSSFMSLGCFTAWRQRETIPKVLLPLNELAYSGQGAVSMGSRLFGKQRYAADETAHFVARQLFGPIGFDAASVSVPLTYSVSQMMSLCAGLKRPLVISQPINMSCISELHSVNLQAIKRFASDVEKELSDMAISRKYFPRIILIPFCRLGTLYNGQEPSNECDAASYHGQAFAMGTSLMVLGPHFKWIANLDRDEFLSFARGKVRFRSAVDIFDALRTSRKGRGVFSFPWLNVYTPDHMVRDLTRSIITPVRNTIELRLLNKDCKEDSACTDLYDDSTGKAVFATDVGMWFGIHRAYSLRRNARNAGDLVSTTQFMSNSLRTWHARTSIRQKFNQFCVFRRVKTPKMLEVSRGVNKVAASEVQYDCDPTWDVWNYQGNSSLSSAKTKKGDIELNESAIIGENVDALN